MWQQLIGKIPDINYEAAAQAQDRQNILTKPTGSLGRLEALSIQVAAITGQSTPVLANKVVITMVGDHGVAANAVSAYPREVTPQMVLNFLHGGAAINVISRHIDARIAVVDIGVAVDLPPHPQLIDKKIAYGTDDITLGPAMSRQQVEDAIIAGIEVVTLEIEKGLDIVATGEMGIGNTTPSAAVAITLMDVPIAEIVGRGTGVDNAGLQRKSKAIEQALDLNRPDPKDGLDVLAKVGGYEIAGLTGVILGAAANRKPVMLGGPTATAAAMVAVMLAPEVKPYLIAGHLSEEKGHAAMLDWLGLDPLLELDLRLGEGTGAALAMSLADAACKILAEMATFQEAGVSSK